MTDYHELAKKKAVEPGIRFTPADALFADASGVLNESSTPALFIGARLCDRFIIDRYIESGAFGLRLLSCRVCRAQQAPLLSEILSHLSLLFCLSYVF